MAGKRTRTVEVTEEMPRELPEELPEELDEELLEEAEGQQLIDDEIEELVGGEDREGFVKLMRFDSDRKKWLGLPSMPRMGFSRDLVAETWGGGLYSMRVYKGKAYKGGRKFEIDPAVKPTRVQPDKAQGMDVAPSWLSATLDKMGDAIKAIADRKPEPAPDPIAMIKTLAETMRALQPPAPAPVAVSEAPTLKDQLALVASIVDVGTKIVDARGPSGGDTGDAYMEMVSKLADPVIDLVKMRAQQEATKRLPRNPVTGPRLVPTPATAAAALPNPKPPTEEQPVTWVGEIQKWVPLIVKRCQAGRSAEDTAFFVMDELSDITLKKLAEIAAMPDFGARAAQILPAELGNYPEWVTEFLAAMQDYLFGEDDDELPNEPPEPMMPVESSTTPISVDVTPAKEPVPTP